MVRNLLSTGEAARLLTVSEGALRRWRQLRTPGTPPWVKIGHAVRYDADDLARWLDQQKVTAG